MAAKKNKDGPGTGTIALNRQATHDYFIEERFEAGLVLLGWEIKSLRAGRVQLKESYVVLKSGEAWLLGSHISPLTSASTHVIPDPVRTRKLLLHRGELSRLIGHVERKGYTLVPLALYWKKVGPSSKSVWPKVKKCMTSVRRKRTVTGSAKSSGS